MSGGRPIPPRPSLVDRPLRWTHSEAILALVGVIGIVASGCYWWWMHTALFGDEITAVISWTIIRTGAPPVLLNFLIPRTPGAQLLARIRAKTWGQGVCAAAVVYLLWDSTYLQYNFWLSQEAAEFGLAAHQTALGVFGFIIIPSLVITAATSTGELVETIRSAHLVRRIELQTQAEIALTRSVLAQAASMAGDGALSLEQRGKLNRVLPWIVDSMDQTLEAIGESVSTIVGHRASYWRRPLASNPQVVDYLDRGVHYLDHGTLEGYRPPDDEPAPPPQQAADPRLDPARDEPLHPDLYRFLQEPTPDEPATSGTATTDLTPDGPPTAAALTALRPARRRRPPPMEMEE